MIAFAGLVVSVAVLVVHFGAGQHSPRLVHVFRRDAVIKNAIGLLVAPGVYALVAMGDIGGSTRDGPETLTVVVALLLMVVALVVTHPRHGEVLAAVDRNRLVRIARRADAVIEVVAQIGFCVAEDEAILSSGAGAWSMSARPGAGCSSRTTAACSRIRRSRFGASSTWLSARCRPRSTTQRVRSKAWTRWREFSGPSAGPRSMPPRSSTTPAPSGLSCRPRDWDELVDLALTEIRWYGAGSPAGHPPPRRPPRRTRVDRVIGPPRRDRSLPDAARRAPGVHLPGRDGARVRAHS